MVLLHNLTSRHKNNIHKNALPTRREAHFSLFFRACLTGSKQHIVNRYHLPDICRYLIGKAVAEQHIPVGAESCQTYILPIEPQAFFLALVGKMISLIHISVKLKNALGRKSVSSSDIKRTVISRIASMVSRAGS